MFSSAVYIKTMADILLQKGLRIFLEKGMLNRIQLSNGVECVPALNGMPCKSPVYVARKPWRKPSAEEMDLLMSGNENHENFYFVSLTSIPSYIKKYFEQINLADCKSVMDINRITQTASYKKALEQTVLYYEKFAVEKNAAIPHQVYFGEPNLPHNTFNKKENFFIGMHLDSWEQKSNLERPAARNRICINLGKEPRWLLFYNLSYTDMANLTGFDGAFLQQPHNMYEVLYKFFGLYNYYPVIKLQINPYEAYIAPTENIIHDGCTEGTVHKDVNLAIRGYYKMPVDKPALRGFRNSLIGLFKK